MPLLFGVVCYLAKAHWYTAVLTLFIMITIRIGNIKLLIHLDSFLRLWEDKPVDPYNWKKKILPNLDDKPFTIWFEDFNVFIICG